MYSVFTSFSNAFSPLLQILQLTASFLSLHDTPSSTIFCCSHTQVKKNISHHFTISLKIFRQNMLINRFHQLTMSIGKILVTCIPKKCRFDFYLQRKEIVFVFFLNCRHITTWRSRRLTLENKRRVEAVSFAAYLMLLVFSDSWQ